MCGCSYPFCFFLLFLVFCFLFFIFVFLFLFFFGFFGFLFFTLISLVCEEVGFCSLPSYMSLTL